MTFNLMPWAEPQFNQNGVPLAGGQLFVYNAGTTTKATSYTDSTGAVPNTNPIILDSNGQCSCWLSPAQNYKFILSPSTDSDPPTNPFWTKDNVSVPTNFAAGNMTDEKGLGGNYGFVAGADFTAGVSTSLTLSQNYGSANNLWIAFDGDEQGADTFSLGGANNETLTFNAVIPLGTNKVYVKGGTALTIGTPGNGAVTDASVAAGSALANRLNYLMTVRDPRFGATGNGTTNDQPAFLLTNGVSDDILVPPGTYLISSNLTLSNRFIFQPGAVLKIAAGATVTFNNGIEAGVFQIFNCLPVSGPNAAGLVVFNLRFQEKGYPEWWGAVTNSSSTDCLPSINACIVACPITELQQADYYVSGPVQLTTPYRSIQGPLASPTLQQTGATARIIVTTGTTDVLFCGLASNPGSVNSFLANSAIKRIVLTRSATIVPPAVGQEINGVAGLRLQYTLSAIVEDVCAAENSLGFVENGCVNTQFIRPYSFRSLQGTTTTNDIFWAFFQNGNASIGEAGGNASSYYIDPSASVGGSPVLTNPIGYLLNDAPVDTFLIRPATASLATGMNITGSGSEFTDQDVHVIGGIFDAFTTAGISMNTLGANAAVSIIDCYAAPSGAATSASACFLLNACDGMVSLTNNQGDCQAGPAAASLMILGSSAGVVANGNMHNGSKQPIVIENSANISVNDIVNNGQVVAGTQAAIYLTTVARTVIDTVVKGAAGAFPQGIWCNGTSVVSTECRMSKVDAGCISGGSGNKLLYNGTQITSAGAFGANLAQGIMT